MRNVLPTLVFMSHIALCSGLATEIPEPFLPNGVTFGMSYDAVKAIRPHAIKPRVPMLPYRSVWPQLAQDGEPAYTNIVTLSEVVADKNPVEVWAYYFSNQKLTAVMYTSAYSSPPKDKTPPFQALRGVLDGHFKKQADERVIRFSEDEFKPVTKFAESWKDERGEITAFLEIETNTVLCVIYDPCVFSKSDFYLSENDVEVLAPVIQALKETREKNKPELEQIEKQRQEAYRQQQEVLLDSAEEKSLGHVSPKNESPEGKPTAPRPTPWKLPLLIGILILGGGVVAWRYFKRKSSFTVCAFIFGLIVSTVLAPPASGDETANQDGRFSPHRWVIDKPVNAMIYLYEQKEGEAWSETLGGIGYPAGTPYFIVGADRECNQMRLQLPHGSAMFWHESGTQFRPVYETSIIPSASRICLMRGYGSLKGWSLWVRVVERPEENVKKVTREWLTGRWRSNVNKKVFDMLADATHKEVGKEGKEHTGTWKFMNGTIVWTYDHLSPNFRDVTPILDAGDDFFMVQEMDGSKTIFTRVKNDPDEPE